MSLIRPDDDPRKRLTVHQHQRLLARYHRGPLTQTEFAASNGIGLSTLSKWLRVERAGDESPPRVRFQEVVLPGVAPGWAVEVVNPQGWTVRLRTPSDVALLSQLLPALPC